MPSINDLPYIDYWGAQRLDRLINVDAIAGALLGVLVGAPLLRVPAFLQSLARHAVGFPWGHVAWAVGWTAVAYAALLALSHWRTLDEEVTDQ